MFNERRNYVKNWKRSLELLFQIKREIALTQQDNMSVAQYYSRLKKLWDQISQLRPSITCACA